MGSEPGLATAPVIRESKSGLKFVRDAATVLEMKLIYLRQTWQWYLMGALIFPMGMFYWSRALAPDDPEAVRRLITGTIIFGVAIMTANSLSDQLVQDRFQGRLKMLITMPIAKGSYAMGVLAFASIQSTTIVVLLLGLAVPIRGRRDHEVPLGADGRLGGVRHPGRLRLHRHGGGLLENAVAGEIGATTSDLSIGPQHRTDGL